jgi:hypothetical protein
MLIDVTDARQIDDLWFQSNRCRRLAGASGDQRTADTLNLMADEYEASARELERPRRAGRPSA